MAAPRFAFPYSVGMGIHLRKEDRDQVADVVHAAEALGYTVVQRDTDWSAIKFLPPDGSACVNISVAELSRVKGKAFKRLLRRQLANGSVIEVYSLDDSESAPSGLELPGLAEHRQRQQQQEKEMAAVLDNIESKVEPWTAYTVDEMADLTHLSKTQVRNSMYAQARKGDRSEWTQNEDGTWTLKRGRRAGEAPEPEGDSNVVDIRPQDATANGSTPEAEPHQSEEGELYELFGHDIHGHAILRNEHGEIGVWLPLVDHR